MRTTVIDIRDVPSAWIYENYIQAKFSGNVTRMKSPFGPPDRRESFSICRSEGWVWKDFRNNLRGSAPMLIYEMVKRGLLENPFGDDYQAACKMVVEDYVRFISSGGTFVSPTEALRWHFSGFQKRPWSVVDRDFWAPYKLSSTDLEENNVFPLAWFEYTRDHGNRSMRTDHNNIYGYFTKTGLLYKIYQPFLTGEKYRKVRDHVEGIDELNPEWKHLMIMSGKKDRICFKKLAININTICPDSETSSFPPGLLESLSETYKISTMLDNDEAGDREMTAYQKRGFPRVDMGMEKDFALCLKNHPLQLVSDRFKEAYKQRK